MRIVVVDAGSFTAHYDANLCRALAARGHEVSLDTSEFLFETVKPLEGYAVRNSFFGFLQRRPAFASRAPLRRTIKAGPYPVEMLRWAADVTRTLPDIVHVQWSLLPFWDERLLARLQRRGARIVLTVHDVEPLPDSGGTSVGSSRLYRRADALIVHSDYSRRRLLDEFHVPEQRIHVVPLGGPGNYVLPTVSRADARAQLGLQDDAVYLLFFGLIKRHKGLDLLLDALAEARRHSPNLRLLIAGEPMQKWSQYASQIARLELENVVDLHLHFIPTDVLPVYLSAADLVVLPYRATFQSGVVLAAYAYELPVLATAVGGLPELVDAGKTGFLVPPDDVPALARALVAAAADPNRLVSMGKAAREHNDEIHGWDEIASRHEEIYREVVATPDAT
jgi:glycosyltransferase involved in cell wall biosynthesis